VESIQNVRGDAQPSLSPPGLTPPGVTLGGPSSPLDEAVGPPRTPSEVPDPVASLRGEQTGRASVTVSYCSYCFNVATEYRSDLGEWLCRRCSQSVPQMCESCQTRKADIIEWGYAVCSSCRAGRNR
jgi:hypothetical protein